VAKRAEIDGQALVLLEARGMADSYRATEEIEATGGRVLHRFGNRVLIGDVERPAKRDAARQSGVAAVHEGAVEAAPGGLSDVESLGLRAWNLRQSSAFDAAKARRPHEGVRWDAAPGPEPPDGPGMAHVTETLPERSFGLGQGDTSLYMIGTVAVGIILVDGPTPLLQFTDDEREKVVAEVMEGLTWLGRQEPKAGLTFSYDIQKPRIDVQPDPGLSGYDALESHWRDPAMANLRYSGNYLGVVDYVQKLRTRLATQWAYVGFFTKYPVAHFAYALKPRLVMQYDNDGWGHDNIDRVFTHETGHIFGAPDEYAASNCTCGAKFGYLREPNGNCQGCAPAFVDCLMAINTFGMCAHTPVHFGWRDSDGDGALDPVDPIGNPSPTIDLGRICQIFPFICHIFGLAPAGAGQAPAAARGVTGSIPTPAEPRPEMVPGQLLRRVLSDEDLQRVEAAIAAEEWQYLEAVERKLRTAADEIRRGMR
jgi:predicted acetyltransferase